VISAASRALLAWEVFGAGCSVDGRLRADQPVSPEAIRGWRWPGWRSPPL